MDFDVYIISFIVKFYILCIIKIIVESWKGKPSSYLLQMDFG
jgi:hypothetical protein